MSELGREKRFTVGHPHHTCDICGKRVECPEADYCSMEGWCGECIDDYETRAIEVERAADGSLVVKRWSKEEGEWI